MAKWNNLKKKLPFNWAALVAKTLTDNGFEVTASYVSDVRRGKIKNIDKQEKVWAAIHALAKLNSKQKQSVKQLTAA